MDHRDDDSLSSESFHRETVTSSSIIDDYLKHLISAGQDARKHSFELHLASQELRLERDLVKAKKNHHQELIEFGDKISSYQNAMKKKSEFKREIYGTIDKIIVSVKENIEAVKNFVSLGKTICESLESVEESQTQHNRELCVYFGEMVNRAIELQGYGDATSEIYGNSSVHVRKIDLSGQRKVEEIARDCLSVAQSLKSIGPVNKSADKICAAKSALQELESQIELIKNKEMEVEICKLDTEIAELKEKNNQLRESLEQTKERNKTELQSQSRELINLIHSNTEKHIEFVSMTKRSEELQEILKGFQDAQQELDEISSLLQDVNNELAIRNNETEAIGDSINQKKDAISELKKQKEIDDFEKDQQKQKILTRLKECNDAVEVKQAKLAEAEQRRDALRFENEMLIQRKQKIQCEYNSAREEIRRKKNEKRRNLKEKRKLRDKLDREIFMLSFTKKSSRSL